jgi:hypothetical protein
VKDHDEGNGFVVPIEMNVVFATKTHAAENKPSTKLVHELIQYGFAPMPKITLGRHPRVPPGN